MLSSPDDTRDLSLSVGIESASSVPDAEDCRHDINSGVEGVWTDMDRFPLLLSSL